MRRGKWSVRSLLTELENTEKKNLVSFCAFVRESLPMVYYKLFRYDGKGFSNRPRWIRWKPVV